MAPTPYISEISFQTNAPKDFVEVVLPAGTDPSGYQIYVYDEFGAVKSSFSLGTHTSTIAGRDVYLADSSTASFGSFGNNDAVALVSDTGEVFSFISFKGNYVTATEGPAAGETSQTTYVSDDRSSIESTDGGATYSEQTAPNEGTVICYAPGTMIDTPEGLRAVETLRPGDLVTTLDHGPQPIRWVRSSDHPLEAVEVDLKPVLIAAGALGPALPSKDLIVSPQHRMLVGGGGQLERQFEAEVLVPAKSLTTLRGIRHMQGKSKITWVHFACDRHEIITANGCLSESLLLSPLVVSSLSGNVRRTLADIFGPAQVGAALNGQPARKTLTVGEVHHLLQEPAEETCQNDVSGSRGWDRDSAMERYEIERAHDTQVRAHSAETASFVS